MSWVGYYLEDLARRNLRLDCLQFFTRKQAFLMMISAYTRIMQRYRIT